MFLISKRKKKAESELLEGCHELHQDSDLELKSLRIVFNYKNILPAVLSKLRSNPKKKSLTRRKTDKMRSVDRLEETEACKEEEEASKQRVS